MFEGLRAPELLLILLIAVLLFGGKRLPDAARGIGRSLRIFKAELRADDEQKDKPTDKPDTDKTA